MKICIPELKTNMKLTKDWTFSLFPESRNKKLFRLLEDKNILLETNIVKTTEDICDYVWNEDEKKKYKIYSKYFCKSAYKGNECFYENPIGGPCCYKLTLSKDTILIPDRYYIRNNLSEFSSVTFRANNVQIPELKKHKLRFWAKLFEVNDIEFEAI